MPGGGGQFAKTGEDGAGTCAVGDDGIFRRDTYNNGDRLEKTEY
jgi:hypothetical protein